jgi:hypothetical protein
MEKAKPHKLERSGDGQFGTVWNYSGVNKIEEAFVEGFFDPVVNNLIPGDSIRVVELNKEIVTAYCEFMVVAKEKLQVFCRPMTKEVVRFEAPASRTPKVHAPVYVEEAKPQFIKGSGEVKWNPGKMKHSVLVDGKEVAAFKDKGEAESVARGDLPLPV